MAPRYGAPDSTPPHTRSPPGGIYNSPLFFCSRPQTRFCALEFLGLGCKETMNDRSWDGRETHRGLANEHGLTIIQSPSGLPGQRLTILDSIIIIEREQVVFRVDGARIDRTILLFPPEVRIEAVEYVPARCVRAICPHRLFSPSWVASDVGEHCEEVFLV